MTRHQFVAWFAISFLLMFALNLSHLRPKGWTAPDPQFHDSVDYLNIAECLASGKGFAHDWENPVWRSTYERAQEAGTWPENDFTLTGEVPVEFLPKILSFHGRAPTAFRPPAVPFLMSIVFAFSKEYFWLVWRLVDSLAVALAAAAATVLSRRIAGVTAALATMLMSYWDHSFLGRFVPSVMTEGISILAVMLLVRAVVLVMERKRLVLVALAGLLTGFLILVRSVFVFWLPGLAILMVACWQWGNKGRLTQALPVAGLYLAVTIGTVTPWCVRNCIILGKFMPLGTQGGWALPGGYSDLTIERHGVHTGLAMSRIWDSYRKVNDVTGLTPLEVERTQAELGGREALRWMRYHWAQLPQLAFHKAETEWRGWRPRRILVVYGLCMLGSLVNWRRRPQVIVLWFVIITHTLAIMVTYAADGRFVVPVLFPCYILIGVGVAEWLNAIQSLDDYLSKARPRFPGSDNGDTVSG